jgi:hypothetical protein
LAIYSKQAKKIRQKKKNSPIEKEFANTSNNKDINILVVLYVLSIYLINKSIAIIKNSAELNVLG